MQGLVSLLKKRIQIQKDHLKAMQKLSRSDISCDKSSLSALVLSTRPALSSERVVDVKFVYGSVSG